MFSKEKIIIFQIFYKFKNKYKFKTMNIADVMAKSAKAGSVKHFFFYNVGLRARSLVQQIFIYRLSSHVLGHPGFL